MVKLVSNHGKIRIKERLGNVRSNSLLRLVLDNGNTKYDYKGNFFQYLVSKEQQKHSKIKVYQNNIYILSKNTKRLITMYSIPDKFFPIDKYKINEIEKKKIDYLHRNKDYVIKFILYDREIEGYVYFKKNVSFETVVILDGEKISCINLKDIIEMISPIETLKI